jgi:hypothetical protein
MIKIAQTNVLASHLLSKYAQALQSEMGGYTSISGKEVPYAASTPSAPTPKPAVSQGISLTSIIASAISLARQVSQQIGEAKTSEAMTGEPWSEKSQREFINTNRIAQLSRLMKQIAAMVKGHAGDFDTSSKVRQLVAMTDSKFQDGVNFACQHITLKQQDGRPDVSAAQKQIQIMQDLGNMAGYRKELETV